MADKDYYIKLYRRFKNNSIFISTQLHQYTYFQIMTV